MGVSEKQYAEREKCEQRTAEGDFSSAVSQEVISSCLWSQADQVNPLPIMNIPLIFL